MNKFFWLTSLAFVCGFAAAAQQPVSDSTVNLQHLPVAAGDSLFVNFSCTVKERNKISVQWMVDSVREGGYFVIERSNDGGHYETVGALKTTNSVTQYELTDNAPFNGSNFYRIKYAGITGHIGYSKTYQVSLSQNGGFKFYPNPVDKLLIIQTDHSMEMQIVSPVGVLLISRQLQPGLQVINVSMLEKGIYLLRVTDKENNKEIIEQLLKN